MTEIYARHIHTGDDGVSIIEDTNGEFHAVTGLQLVDSYEMHRSDLPAELATASMCSRCQPPCSREEQCDMCGGHYFHDYVHWNGAFYQCEHCSQLERDDPAQNGLDPIFGGTFSQHMHPAYEPYQPATRGHHNHAQEGTR